MFIIILYVLQNISYTNKMDKDNNYDNQNGVADNFKPNSTHTMYVFQLFFIKNIV